jgi:nucleoside-diphosphate-sugar epimerase
MDEINPIKKVSILGCGWLGLPLAVELVAAGYEVKGSTTTPEKLEMLSDAGISPFLVQLTGGGHQSQLPGFFESDLLIISYPPGVRKGGSEQFKQGFEVLLEHIQRSPAKKIIFVSSTSVYPNVNGPVTESMDTEPDSPAGKALTWAENGLLSMENKSVTILRMAGLIGYDRQPARFFAGKSNLKNGDEVINLIHRDDCVGILRKAVDSPETGIFNCCSDTHPRKKDFYCDAAAAMGLPQPIFDSDSEAGYKIVSNDKVKEKLGFKFKYGDLSRFDWP